MCVEVLLIMFDLIRECILHSYSVHAGLILIQPHFEMTGNDIIRAHLKRKPPLKMTHEKNGDSLLWLMRKSKAVQNKCIF